MDTPIKDLIGPNRKPDSAACMSTHREREKHDGSGRFLLEYPKLHELAASKNSVVRELHDFLIKLNPSRTAAFF